MGWGGGGGFLSYFLFPFLSFCSFFQLLPLSSSPILFIVCSFSFLSFFFLSFLTFIDSFCRLSFFRVLLFRFVLSFSLSDFPSPSFCCFVVVVVVFFFFFFFAHFFFPPTSSLILSFIHPSFCRLCSISFFLTKNKTK